MTPPLPPGFVLNEALPVPPIPPSGGEGGHPPLPPGFVLNEALPVPPIPPEGGAPVDADGVEIDYGPGPQSRTSRLALPTTDRLREILQPAPNARYGGMWPIARDVDEAGNPVGNPRLAMPDMIRNPLIGMLDIGQVVGSGGTKGPVRLDDTGNPLSMRPTTQAIEAMWAGALGTPARGTYSAIQQTRDYGAPLADLYARNRPAPQVATPLVTALQQGMPEEMRIAAPGPSPARLAEALAGGERQSVGAAGTPSNLTAMPAREAAASRATGERSQLMETARPGDAMEYVPGVKPTLAEIEQNAEVSREAKTLRIENPMAIAERAANDAERYADYFGDIAGTPTMLNRAKEARAAQAARDLKSAWQDKMKANVQPVLDVAEAIKAGDDGRRRLVRTAIDKVVSEMKERDGSLTTDPELLYGARKNLDDLLSKEAQRQTPLSARAEAALLSIKAALDDAIEGAAPGFRKYLTNFAEASKPIDVMTIMQEAVPNLFQGASRAVAFHRFDRFMRDLISDRAAHGVHPAKSINETTWEKLVAMHKSLQRTAAAELQARAPGSDTAANFYDMSKLGIRAAAHAVGALVMPGLGNVAAHIGANYLDKKSAAARLTKHLDPDLSKYSNYDNPFARGLTNTLKSDFPNNQKGP